MTTRRVRARIRHALVVALLAGAPAASVAQVPLAPLPAPQTPAGTLELLLDQGRRLFDAFQYDQALPLFDRLILSLAPGQAQRPDLLVQALELRARTRFALGDTQGAEQDFSALLAANPSHKLATGISPRVVSAFEAVRKLVVGQLVLSMTPAGEARLDGQPMTIGVDPMPIDVAAGEHLIAVTRQGYRPVEQRITVAPGVSTPVALTLERVSATLSLTSVPEGVEVWLDGTLRGTTTASGAAGGPSQPMVLADVMPGPHRLQLRRPCYEDLERTLDIERPDDLTIEPLRLTPAIASVRIQTNEPGAALFVDGVARGAAPADIADLCAGPHVIEVRGTRGRFVDRREWSTGDAVTLTASLTPAFAIVSSSGVPAERRLEIERSLAGAKGVLIFQPADQELAAALRGENLPPNWIDPTAPGAPVSREAVRDLSSRLSTKLATQGVAAVATAADRGSVTLALLAAGSGEPDVITYVPADPSSRAEALARLSAALPAIMRPSIDSAVVDVAGISGAVVVRPGGLGAKAGLAVGDVIIGAGTDPIASVAELKARLDALTPTNLDLPLQVRSPAGTTRTVAGAVALVPDTVPFRNSALLYNRAISDLQDAVRVATTPVARAAARVNLAIAHLRLGNASAAETELRAADLPAGPGVSAGTVAYLLGLSLEALGRTADARAAFTKAAEATDARLSYEGPLVAPLARQRLGR